MTISYLHEFVTPFISFFTGFKLTQKCSGKGQRSTCKKCSDGTYQDNMNHFPNCFSCRSRCDPLCNYIFVHDFIVMFVHLCFKKVTNFLFLFSSSLLTAKEIEIRNCTHKEDRICGCQKGYYKYEVNDMTMSCKPCRKCGEGERMISPCKSLSVPPWLSFSFISLQREIVN